MNGIKKSQTFSKEDLLQKSDEQRRKIVDKKKAQLAVKKLEKIFKKRLLKKQLLKQKHLQRTESNS